MKEMTMHFRNGYVGSSFIIQIIEIFPGTGYKNNNVCVVERAKRLKRVHEDAEDHLSLRPKRISKKT